MLKMVVAILLRLGDWKYVFMTAVCGLFVFFFSMDIVLYQTLQSTTLVEEAAQKYPKLHSPFHPLTVKLLTLDHVDHYVVKPTCEVFNYVTDFSNVFYFITPNMIGALHVCVGLFVGKFVSSENMRDRRIGVLLYEFRTWLDGLDGVVYRSRNADSRYTTHDNIVGSQIDNICDIIGGIALSLGVLFYLFKYYHKTYNVLTPWLCNERLSYVILPVSIPNGINGALASGMKAKEAGNCKGAIVNGKGVVPSKFHIFLKIVLFGTLVSMAGRTWEINVARGETLFETAMDDPELTVLQTTFLHSGATWWVCWTWRLVGQMFLHYLCFAIVVDKIWEYISGVIYIGSITVVVLNMLSYCHFNYIRRKSTKSLQA